MRWVLAPIHSATENAPVRPSHPPSISCFSLGLSVACGRRSQKGCDILTNEINKDEWMSDERKLRNIDAATRRNGGVVTRAATGRSGSAYGDSAAKNSSWPCSDSRGTAAAAASTLHADLRALNDSSNAVDGQRGEGG